MTLTVPTYEVYEAPSKVYGSLHSYSWHYCLARFQTRPKSFT